MIVRLPILSSQPRMSMLTYRVTMKSWRRRRNAYWDKASVICQVSMSARPSIPLGAMNRHLVTLRKNWRWARFKVARGLASLALSQFELLECILPIVDDREDKVVDELTKILWWSHHIWKQRHIHTKHRGGVISRKFLGRQGGAGWAAQHNLRK